MLINIFFILILATTEGGYIKLMYDNPKTSDEVIKDALEKYPKSYQIYLNGGYLSLNKGDYKLSEEYYEEAYNIYPSLDPLLGYTFSLLKNKKYEKLLSTIEYHNKNVKKVEHPWLANRETFALFKLKKYKKLVEQGEKYIKKYPKDNDIRYNLAMGYLYTKQFKKGKTELKYLISKNYKVKEIKDILKILEDINEKKNSSIDLLIDGGGLLYKNFTTESFNYVGIYPGFAWRSLYIDGGFIYGSGKGKNFTIKQNEYDIGMGYFDKNNSLYLHYKFIDTEYEDGNGVFGAYGYRFIELFKLSLSFGYFNINSENFYQTELSPQLFLLKERLSLKLDFGYKWAENDRYSNFFISFETILRSVDWFEIKFYLSFYDRYNKIDNYGFIIDDTGEDIFLNTKLTFSFIFENWIISPYIKFMMINLEDAPENPNQNPNRKKDFAQKYGGGLQINYNYKF